MQIDRKKARDLLDIKRSLPYDMQDQFKLSSPNIEEIIFDIHQTASDENLKKLTKSFLVDANDKWATRLAPPKHPKLQSAVARSGVIVDKMLAVLSKPITLRKFH